MPNNLSSSFEKNLIQPGIGYMELGKQKPNKIIKGNKQIHTMLKSMDSAKMRRQNPERFQRYLDLLLMVDDSFIFPL